MNLENFVIMKNPYTFGVPVRGEGRFFGREKEQRIIIGTLENVPRGQKQDMAVLGPRRIGKSSLLYRLVDLLTAHDEFVPVLVDIQGIVPQNIPTLFYTILTKVKTGYQHKGLSTELPEFKFLTSSVSEAMLFVTFNDDLTRLNNWIANHQHPQLVIIFDETELITRFGEENFLPWLRSVIQSSFYIIFIVAGSDKLYAMTQDYGSPFYNIFKSILIKPLTIEAARNLIQQPAKKIGLGIDEVETKTILDYTGNSPYFVQGICHYLVEHLNRQQRYQVKPDDIKQILQFSVEHFSAQFEYIWNSTSEVQKVLLYYLSQSKHPQTISQLVVRFTELQKQSRQEQQEYFADLEQLQVLHQGDKEHYWFVVPLFVDWILSEQTEEKIAQIKEEAFERSYQSQSGFSSEESERRSISVELYSRLRHTLLETDFFDNDRTLRALFVDNRISLWRNYLPEADSLRARVEKTIGFLFNRYNANKKNALVLFLQVLRDMHDPREALHDELIRLARELESSINEPDNLEPVSYEVDKALDVRKLRGFLMSMDDTELEFFVLDYFPEVSHKFTDNMAKDRKTFLLIKEIRKGNYERLIQAIRETDSKAYYELIG